jgi:hypothetical protein
MQSNAGSLSHQTRTPMLKRALTLAIGLALACAIELSLPVHPVAAAAAAPTIKKAAMVDSNKNGKVDELVLTYSSEVNHKLQTSGTFPFSVEGYVVKSVAAATNSTKLIIHLAERTIGDLTVTPFVTYKVPATDPVVGTTGKAATDQTFIRTIAAEPADAIYVATTGSDTNPGTKASPKLTIEAAITTAASRSPIPDVYVSAGTYSEPSGLMLVTGVNVDGGYTTGTWTRSLTATTTLQGAPQAALASGVSRVTLQLLSLSGLANVAVDPSVYGLRLVSSNLALERVSITAAAGSPGTGGSSGGTGAAGGGGVAGTNAGSSAAGTGGAGGVSSVGATGGAGGAGVSNITSGITGDPGAGSAPGGGGNAGVAGSCSLVSASSGGPGGIGGSGTAGSNGVSGSGGTASTAGASSTWSGASGGSGTSGTDGSGGGGGGSGGGSDYPGGFLDMDCIGATSGGGGGGGGGGGASSDGGAGTFGGGSFGIYLWNSVLSIDASSKVTAGAGGAGGAGGTAAAGGAGGTAGGGGLGWPGSTQIGSGGPGNAGGLGGAGGAAGPGGGGAGGPSIGVFRGGTSTATIATGAAISFAAGGPGGAGGTSPVLGTAQGGAVGVAEALF